MDKFDILMVRVSKTNLTQDQKLRRIQKIWGMRCALGRDYPIDFGIGMHIWQIAKATHNPRLEEELFIGLNPERHWYHGIKEGTNYWESFVLVLLSLLSITPVKDIPGYKPSTYWKNYEKEINS